MVYTSPPNMAAICRNYTQKRGLGTEPAVSQKLDGLELSAYNSLQPGRLTETTEYNPLGRGRHVHPPPTGLQTPQGQAQDPLPGAYMQRKERESLKVPFINFYQMLC